MHNGAQVSPGLVYELSCVRRLCVNGLHETNDDDERHVTRSSGSTGPRSAWTMHQVLQWSSTRCLRVSLSIFWPFKHVHAINLTNNHRYIVLGCGNCIYSRFRRAPARNFFKALHKLTHVGNWLT